MKGSAKVVKGRIEEAAGALTGKNKLRARGLKDQAAGRIQQSGEKDVQQVKKAARKIVDKAKKTAREADDRAQNR